MTVRLTGLVFALVLLAACGGGGGGGSNPPAATPPPVGGGTPDPDPAPDPAPDPTPDPDPDPAPDPDPVEPAVASASITFPWPNSSTSASTVTVRGIAESSAGVTQVRIGGVVADIGIAPQSSSNLGGLPRLGGTTSATGIAPLSNDSPTKVEFSASLTLSGGRARLPVTVEDGDGNTSDELDEVSVALEGVPDHFTLDAVGGRLIGPSFQASVAANTPTLVSYNFITDEVSLRPSPASALPGGTCFIASQEWFVYATWTGSGDVAIEVLVLDSPVGFRAAVLDFDPGPEWGTPQLEALACASASSVVHVLQRFPPEDGVGEDLFVVLAVDLDAETVTELALPNTHN